VFTFVVYIGDANAVEADTGPKLKAISAERLAGALRNRKQTSK
jgi:hypothetical protein